MHLVLRPHVPHARHSVASPGHQQVQRWVQLQIEYAAEVAVVVPYDLVRFQIPAFDHLILSRGEEVGMSGTEGHTANGTNVARECDFEGVRCPDACLGEVEEFDGPIGGSGGEHVVGGVKGYGSDPAKMVG